MLDSPRPDLLLSIVIPTHNWDVGGLLDKLGDEITAHGLHRCVHVDVFDDASTPASAAASEASVHRNAQRGLRAQFYRSDHNVGRSAARNALVARARGTHLLFLDADVLPDSTRFLRNYLAQAHDGAMAVCGGISYTQCGLGNAETRFYLRYSSATSVAPARLRMERPWAWLYTANVMVACSLVAQVPFDDGFIGYGYEDLEWGIRLASAGGLSHIDNPVTHLGLLSKATLQRKMRESTPNLLRLVRLHPQSAEELRLVRVARRLRSLPNWVLAMGAAMAGAAFSRTRGPYPLEFASFQLEKLFLGAHALKAAGI